MSVTIYHNPDCGTSRNTLAMIRQSGVEPTIIEYLKTPPSRDTLKQLIAAMGISASSFYNSFGGKEALYCEATKSYLEWAGHWFFAILNDPAIDTKTAFARLFEATAEEFTRGDHPLGCMISLAGTHCAPGMKSIREMMAEHRAFSESAMADRIRKGVANGDVPADTDCDLLAAYLSAVARGLAVQARDGVSREKLAEIGRLAMCAWPAGKAARRSGAA